MQFPNVGNTHTLGGFVFQVINTKAKHTWHLKLQTIINLWGEAPHAWRTQKATKLASHKRRLDPQVPPTRKQLSLENPTLRRMLLISRPDSQHWTIRGLRILETKPTRAEATLVFIQVLQPGLSVHQMHHSILPATRRVLLLYDINAA